MMKALFLLFAIGFVNSKANANVISEEGKCTDTFKTFFFFDNPLSLVTEEQQSRIVGGELAKPGEFPYQVFIENVFNSSEILKCGGTLYKANYVITAAHCLYFKVTLDNHVIFLLQL